MKTAIFTLLISAFAFAGCTTKDNSMKDATGSGIAAQNGGVQTTGSVAPAASAAMPSTDAAMTGSSPVASPSATPAAAQ